jgi:hypothetical protein
MLMDGWAHVGKKDRINKCWKFIGHVLFIDIQSEYDAEILQS